MDENKTQNEALEQEGEEQSVKTENTKKSKSIFGWHIRNPFYRDKVEKPEAPATESDEESESEEEQTENPKPKKGGRFKTFLRGLGTGVLIVGSGLVAYGKYKQRKDQEAAEEEYVEISDEDDDDEENRTLTLPPREEDSEDEEESKEKETEE